MQQIKIFRKYMEDAGNGSYDKFQKTVNDWLKSNPEISVVNIFQANMADDDGDGHFVMVVVYAEKEALGFQ